MARPCQWMIDKDKDFIASVASDQLLLDSGQPWSRESSSSVGLVAPQLLLRGMETWSKRSSHASDTSSAYSGSDVMQSSADDLEADFSGLPESDGEEGFSESLIVRDQVREYLEKEPSSRTETDLEVLLDFMQHMPAFSNMTLTVRRALCSVMVFAVIPKADTTIYGDGQEMDCWSVVLNGHVEVSRPDGTIEHLHMGDSFGVTAVTEKLQHCGTMRTKADDCQFVHVKQQDYHRILNQGNQSICHVEEHGEVVLVVEKRRRDDGKEGQVILRGTPEKLILQLIENNAIDHNYIDDFLLMHRTFLKSPLEVTRKLQSWLQDPAAKERAARIVLLWVNNHFRDFESNAEMMEFLERFEVVLEGQKMFGQLRLLSMAYEARAHPRLVVLSRSTRDEILYFSIVGGVEKKSGVFVAKVDKTSKAYEAGLTRGDQILEVNKHNFEHIQHDKALEILRGNTQLAITVKSNLQAFRKVLQLTDNPSKSDMPPKPTPNINSVSGSRGKKDEKHSTTIAQVANIRQALLRMNLQSKAEASDDQTDNGQLTRSASRKHSAVPNDPASIRPLSLSSPDLTSIPSTGGGGYPGYELPDQVVKIYRADQTFKYLLILKETTAREVVMLALTEFGITDPSRDYSLNEVTFEDCGLVKSRHLPDQLTNLSERIRINSRYYLRNTKSMDPLVPDELVEGIIREGQTSLLELDAGELSIQLMREDYQLFKDIEQTEYIDDLFDLDSKAGCPHLNQFSQLVNREMFWVITEICSEPNPIRRAKIIKQFIKLARYCKVVKNFNSMFAILSGLGHGAVSRLRLSWDKVPAKYVKLFEEMQQLMDPSRNMSKYRNMLTAHMVHPPVIPFFPLVKKDLTFIHYGNDSKVEGLVNFDKLRMIAKEVHQQYTLATGVLPSASTFCRSSTGEYTSLSTSALATMKRKKSNAGVAPNLKKMYDDMLMARKARTYLMNLKVNEDETQLSQMSSFYEPSGKSVVRRVESSADPIVYVPPSTESLIANPMFGTDSQKAVHKLLTLTDKVKPLDQKRASLHTIKSVPTSPVRTPKKSHSTKQRPLPAVDLSRESSSVTGVNVKQKSSFRGHPRLSSTKSVVPSGISLAKKVQDSDSGNGSVTSSVGDSQSLESFGDPAGSPSASHALHGPCAPPQFAHPWCTSVAVPEGNQSQQSQHPNVFLSPAYTSVASRLDLTPFIPSQSVRSYSVPPQPVPSYAAPSYPVPSHCVPSQFVSPQSVLNYPTASQPMSNYAVPSYIVPPHPAPSPHPVPPPLTHQPRPMRPPAYDVAVRFSSGYQQNPPVSGHYGQRGQSVRYQLLPDYPSAGVMTTAAAATARLQQQDACLRQPGVSVKRGRSYSYDAVLGLSRGYVEEEEEDEEEFDEQEDGYGLSDEEENGESGLVSVV